jgi:hypothetical protein
VVFNVRCFKCGEQAVRLILGGRAIIHARCHACDSNLLAEVMALQEEAEGAAKARKGSVQEPPPTANIPFPSNERQVDEGLKTGS